MEPDRLAPPLVGHGCRSILRRDCTGATGRLEKSYAETLLAVVDFISATKPPRPALGITFGESRSLKSRIAMVANKSVRSRISAKSRALLAVATVLLFAIPIRAQDKPKPTTPPTTAAADQKADEKSAEKKPAPADEQLQMPKDVQPDELAGVVVDAQGKPLAGVLVDAWTGSPGSETTTDENGVFRFKPGDNGRPVEVRFSKPSYSPHYNVAQPQGVKDLVITLGNKTYIEEAVPRPRRQAGRGRDD